MDFTNSFSNVHLITLHVPVGCTRNYETRSPWNNFKEIVEYAPGGEGDEQCAVPSVYIEDGLLKFSCTTAGAKYYYTINCDDQTALTESESGAVELAGTYKVQVYAYADGYENSETVTATLVWVNPMLEGTDILSMEAKKAVLISAQGSTIVVSGTAQDEGIQLYSIDGRLLSAVTAGDGQTIIPCSAAQGTVVIVKYGDKAVKLLIK